MTNQELFRRLKDGDESIRDEIIVQNIGLVKHIARRYRDFRNPIGDPDDLISEGYIGLIKAVDTFDVDRGISFATYAAACIGNSIRMVFRRIDRAPDTTSLDGRIMVSKHGDQSGEILLREVIAETGIPFEERIESRMLIEKAFSCIDALTERERTAFMLNVQYGRHASQYELARMEGISQPNFSRTLRRAQNKISRMVFEGGI